MNHPSGKVSASELKPRNLIPLKIRRVLGLLQAKSYLGDQTSSGRCGDEAWRGWCRLKCRLRHPTAAQSQFGHICPQIALVLLQNGAQI
ncbi:hypothetical protein AVEN_189150-1 [Araneus ventricosus]|uniref:Uncharacterized protein n=1 Tax=Araneus ventricosus TaxID=182803 RepID=A0A4Y2NLB0_ARAVE|nr:hypothetical protein AVEN_189150-1 [Araneus ventricosus]